MSASVGTVQKQQKKQQSAYRLTAGERKLPRPVVFWSDNEKDAFRRNKVVQTRYTMILDDIENQRKSSFKNIKHETHKYRVRSSKYKTENKNTESDTNGVPVQTDITSGDKENDEKDDEDDDISSDSSSEKEEEDESKNKKKDGIITKHKRPSVKFSVYKEFIPNSNDDAKNELSMTSKTLQKRGSSAPLHRQVPELPKSYGGRSKSAVPQTVKSSARSDSERPLSSISKTQSECSSVSFRPRSSMFFDRSVAAFELRKELQRLAKLRKTTVITTPYTITDALRDERERYSENRQKVQKYLQKLEIIKKEETVINKWTQEEVEQSLHLA
ncbi:hypothetical protein FSP39_009613 [Pinctada imbricata]|uniref:Uncharacterized protein n=1 Tax=Pinctada imbricata TaxID=66713 RepID=A0AA88YA13_PINIB|nr:hypothetical protein FSP39_009613 [Pinctada imbricata]